MLLEFPLATYANFPEGSIVTETGFVPVATVPIYVNAPLFGSMMYIETSLEVWLATRQISPSDLQSLRRASSLLRSYRSTLMRHFWSRRCTSKQYSIPHFQRRQTSRTHPPSR